jgi:hypothetical protein
MSEAVELERPVAAPVDGRSLCPLKLLDSPPGLT